MVALEVSAGRLLEDFVERCLWRILDPNHENPLLQIRREWFIKDDEFGRVAVDFFVENNRRTNNFFFPEKSFFVEIKTRLSPNDIYLAKLKYYARFARKAVFVVTADDNVKSKQLSGGVTIYGLPYLKLLALIFPEIARACHVEALFDTSDGKKGHPVYSPDWAGVGREEGVELRDSHLRELIDEYSKWCRQNGHDSKGSLRKDHVPDEEGFSNSLNFDCGLVPASSDALTSVSTRDGEANDDYFKADVRQKKKLVMILGNGVSMDFGSATWSKLSGALADYLYPMYSDNLGQLLDFVGDSNLAKTQISSAIISPMKYHDALYNQIYGKYEPKMMSEDTLLAAVGDVFMKKESTEIATYNYDEFLEMYLRDKGYSRFASAYDSRTENSVVKKGMRPIIHLHGFMPFEDKEAHHKGKNIVLTMGDYFGAYKNGVWCARRQKEWIDDPNCTVLFVGSSMTDAYQLSIIANSKNATRGVYALFALNGIKKNQKNYLSLKRYYEHIRVHPIFVDTFNDLPDKLRELFDLSFADRKVAPKAK